jgi:cardiolipin synthase
MPSEKENLGLRLLKNSRKGILRMVFSRTALITLLLLINFALLFLLFFRFSAYWPEAYGLMGLLSIAMALYLFNSQLDPSAKLTWLVLISLLPVFGTLFYLFTLTDFGHRAMVKRWKSGSIETNSAMIQDKPVMQQLKTDAPELSALSAYINRTGCFPVFDNTDVRYFPSGEAKYEALLKELEKAQHFIFLEYFIIEEGVMWGNILNILARKAKEGVEVRLLYDGSCEFALLPRSYPKMLEELGIKCRVFAPVSPFVSTHYNYRDHRKILVIDGNCAFTGGINLADEYINRGSRFGHWKDCAIMLRGEAVKSFTLMFLQMWCMADKTTELGDYLDYPANPPADASGYVMPYGDSPLDAEHVGKQVYVDILNRAERYVHIMSPYLILDAETENALKFAAKRGVDVALILPGIPDKKLPYALAKGHYKSLLSAGVKIYEYSPGFVHSKLFVSDDIKAVVGTINLDYRSFSHHFECAAYMHGTGCIKDIEADFENTLKLCRRVSMETVKKEKLSLKLLGILMKVVAPLM